VGSLAGAVALTAAVSWRNQRKRENEAEVFKRKNDRDFEVWKVRTSYYDKIAVSVVQQFVGIVDVKSMAEDRGRVVLWGSAAVVQALERWDVVALEIRTAQEVQGRDERNSDDEKRRLWAAFTDLLQAMRAELPDELKPDLTNEAILRAVFSDYRELDDMGKVPAGASNANDE
jgi:hypothetical protein